LSDEANTTIEPLPARPAGAIAALQAVRDGAVRLRAVLHEHGSPNEPETPSIQFRTADAPFDRVADLEPLTLALIEAADASGLSRVVAGWDPMDHAGLKVLERHGFRPTGVTPYFDLGGGQVQFVTGYQDATGAVLDLAREPQ